ncbi:MAG: AMP-binding protein [Desulfuromonadaceae bacterium]|nr:AMP-binding protein [Desulfuromonadaceae bacterium]MDD2856289.1 AMP-binding protein [Desulfuromonadaceae bacterium]
MNELIVAGQYNIGHICTTHQCKSGLKDKTAMRWVSAHHERTDYTFGDLDAASNRFANLLDTLGVLPGDIFFTFLPKMPEQFFAFLGTLKHRTICGTLFSNFGEDALLDRLSDSKATGIITKKSFLRKIKRIWPQLPELRFVILVDIDEHSEENVYSYKQLMDAASAEWTTALTPPETPSVLHYTSGSTGKPKGALHAHRSVLLQNSTTRDVLAVNSNDIYWCTADQGWVTGTSYGIIGPWSLGVTQVHFGGVYDASVWMDLIQTERITVWYTAPTALRMLMRESPELYAPFDLSSLRHISSVGEPLNPEVMVWGEKILGKKIYDTWFQTETGGILIPNRPGTPIRHGSMGKPIDEIEAAILSDDGSQVGVNTHGNLCIKSGWSSMFITYINNQEKYDSRFRDGYYYTGDTAYRDDDGYFWFVGRSDDVINTSGHLVSPFEVESALLELDEIVESGVVGVPDDLLFEKVITYVALRDGITIAPELDLKIKLHISNRLSSIAAPHEVIAIEKIPKNKSGKIMRRVLKAWYLGLDAGDISTMED